MQMSNYFHGSTAALVLFSALLLPLVGSCSTESCEVNLLQQKLSLEQAESGNKLHNDPQEKADTSAVEAVDAANDTSDDAKQVPETAAATPAPVTAGSDSAPPLPDAILDVLHDAVENAVDQAVDQAVHQAVHQAVDQAKSDLTSRPEDASSTVADTIADSLKGQRVDVPIEEMESAAADSFATLKNDLAVSASAIGSAQALADKFKAVTETVWALDREAASAEATKLKALREMEPLLNITVSLDSTVEDHVPDRAKSIIVPNSSITDATAAAEDAAGKAAELAEVVEVAEKEFVAAMLKRDQALEEQTAIVRELDENLRTAILVGLNDTRLVEALNESDRRWSGNHTHRSEPETTPEPTTSSGEVYPSEAIIIGLLILLGVAIAALTVVQQRG
eukprot:gb/GFBE01005771.1/.p1 GENE.gb/GFBE01005771.1/~~gb/GFBE01005771.1/.p1  ORF type:complete len:394 (+),score=97.02 gb/GFBE01005771.1/:1-1182(+)